MAIDTVSWIICLGAERTAVEGIVSCPLEGDVDLSRCLDCHLLETVAAERGRDRECEVGGREPIIAGNW